MGLTLDASQNQYASTNRMNTFGNNITISFWYKLTSDITNEQPIISFTRNQYQDWTSIVHNPVTHTFKSDLKYSIYFDTGMDEDYDQTGNSTITLVNSPTVNYDYGIRCSQISFQT